MAKKGRISLVTVFAGKPWEAGLLKSLLENAEINAFLKDDTIGSLAPWYAGPGGTSAVKVIVADTDLDKARIVVEEFEKNMKKD